MHFFENLDNYYIDHENRLFVHAGFTNHNGVKDESFETPEGIKGLRAYGSFYVANAAGKVGKEPHQYELLVFDQQGGIQTVMVAYVDDDRFAQGLKERIINSVSLEIPQTQQKPEAP